MIKCCSVALLSMNDKAVSFISWPSFNNSSMRLAECVEFITEIKIKIINE